LFSNFFVTYQDFPVTGNRKFSLSRTKTLTVIHLLAAEKLGLATSPRYLALSSSGNANYANGASFASGGAGVSNATNKVCIEGYRSRLHCKAY
jgi:hypothetical protein